MAVLYQTGRGFPSVLDIPPSTRKIQRPLGEDLGQRGGEALVLDVRANGDPERPLAAERRARRTEPRVTRPAIAPSFPAFLPRVLTNAREAPRRAGQAGRNRGGGPRTATIDTVPTDPHYLQVNDLIPGSTIYVQRTTTTRNVDIYTGTGAVTINVLATIGRGLNLHGNSALTAVNVGNGNLDGIQGLQMTISNSNSATAVVIDDRNRGGSGGASHHKPTAGGASHLPCRPSGGCRAACPG